MPRRPTHLPDRFQGTFRVKDAQARGVGQKRLRGADLSVPFSGVRVAGGVGTSVLDRCRAYAEIMAPGVFFSHRTAARIHGIPLRGNEADEPLHVTVFQPDRAPRVEGIIGHHARVESVDVVLRDGLFVVSPAHTLRQLAAQLSVEELVVAGDALVAGRRPLCTLEELSALLPRSGGRRGVATLREALALVRVGSESPQETRLRLLLVGAGLPEPKLNVDIHDRFGRFVARGDLVYPEHRVVVEYDGDQHRTDRRQYERDVERLEGLGAEDWRVVRVLGEHMRRPAGVIARVRSALSAGS